MFYEKLLSHFHDITFFKIHQNSSLLFFITTRSHNITTSQQILFFAKLKRRSTERGCGKKVDLPVAHQISGAQWVYIYPWSYHVVRHR
jgi:hypothetical protein